MEYLPWVVMAFGLFLLFVTRQVRQRGNVADEATYSDNHTHTHTHTHTHIAYSQHPGRRELHVNTKDLKDPTVLHAPQKSHGSEIWMPIILSLFITGAALVVILLPGYYGEAQQKWAFGVIGLILGYWFKK
ncbi:MULTISPECIES: hypothetical protein [unclassified Pseudomonas]|uniref:hypothetical protein n=1 Tax=unclassified Pseudomonas TaxID=196821 RepID=UPI000C885382|nr:MULTISPECIES: hypothetical protein [unclassified Pseudomonas]PNA01241.1 hypothetical protein C1X28_25675 [Pseudomonas sp. FW305-BF15]PNB78261.1 hypothetical protein C1X30_24615 [Pseudomonas sp. FW305-BF6]